MWRLQDARARTLRILNDLPSDIAERETSGNSLGTILYHVALIECDWLYSEILEEPIPEEIRALLPEDDRDDAGALTSIWDQSLTMHLTRLSAIRETFLLRLRGMTTQDFRRARSLPDYDVSPAWVLHHLAQHEAEHRSELDSAIARIREAK